MKLHLKARASQLSKFRRKGSSLNKIINKLPIEVHLPGYNFCGPGTNLDKRLARGDKGINALDEACKEHDIAYSKFSDISTRHIADKILQNKAFNLFKSKKASFKEKATALGVGTAMGIKRKLGMGLKKKRKIRKCTRKGNGITLHQAISKARKAIKGKKFKSLKTSIKAALNSLPNGVKMTTTKTRIIPVPKTGGFLPLVPIFAGLSALGSLGAGTAAVAKAISDARSAAKTLEEAKRHNKTIESIALGKRGQGLYLRPYKTGMGLYISKNF